MASPSAVRSRGRGYSPPPGGNDPRPQRAYPASTRQLQEEDQIPWHTRHALRIDLSRYPLEVLGPCERGVRLLS